MDSHPSQQSTCTKAPPGWLSWVRLVSQDWLGLVQPVPQCLPTRVAGAFRCHACDAGAVDSMQDVCEQCNLAGKCLAGGQCSCLQGWTGPTCGVLDLVPGTAQPAFHKASRAGVAISKPSSLMPPCCVLSVPQSTSCC